MHANSKVYQIVTLENPEHSNNADQFNDKCDYNNPCGLTERLCVEGLSIDKLTSNAFWLETTLPVTGRHALH